MAITYYMASVSSGDLQKKKDTFWLCLDSDGSVDADIILLLMNNSLSLMRFCHKKKQNCGITCRHPEMLAHTCSSF